MKKSAAPFCFLLPAELKHLYCTYINGFFSFFFFFFPLVVFVLMMYYPSLL